MRIVDLFFEQCQEKSHEPALKILSHSGAATLYTWGELEQLTLSTIARLFDACEGLKFGEHIATWIPNGLSWILTDLACQAIGCVHVALDTRLSVSMAAQLVRHSGARLLVAHNADHDALATQVPMLDASTLELACQTEVREAHEEVHRVKKMVTASTPAQLLYTSGTISQPKGALLSHGNLLSNAQAKLQAAPQLASDVRLNILPFAHAYARTCELSTWIISRSQLCIAGDWETFIKWAPVVEPTLVNLVPHLVYRLHDLLDASRDSADLLGHRLRLLQVGGAGLREEVWHSLAAKGWPPLQGYGLTETSPVICSNRAGQQRFDSVGLPVAGVEVSLDDDGVLWTRGPHVMLGYWQDDAATRAKMRDGWFCTGDIAERSSDGTLRILGRIDDQITLSTGYKVAETELTRRLASDPWLQNIVLVGHARPFVAALIYPRLDQLPAHLFVEEESLRRLNVPLFIQAITAHLQTLTHDLPRSMQIERVAVMEEPLSVENGGLNFKGAVRRAHIERVLCKHLLEQIYDKN